MLEKYNTSEGYTMKKLFTRWMGLIIVCALIFIPATTNAAVQTRVVNIDGQRVQISAFTNSRYAKTLTTQDKDGVYSFNLNTISDTLTLTVKSTETKKATTQTFDMKALRAQASKFKTQKSFRETSIFWDNYYYIDGNKWTIGNSDGDQKLRITETDENTEDLEKVKDAIDDLADHEISAICEAGIAIVGLVVAAITAPTGVGAIVGLLLFFGGAIAAAYDIWQMYKCRDKADYAYERVSS